MFLKDKKKGPRSSFIDGRQLSGPSKETHVALRKLRNTYIAHSENKKLENCRLLWPFHIGKKGTSCSSRPIEIVSQAYGEEDLADSIRTLVFEQLTKIDKKIKKSYESLMKQLTKCKTSYLI